MADALQFPPHFRFGVSTASYQIEGAVGEDGRGPSIWDTFSHTAGATRQGDTGDVACDHYHRMADDVALMGELGVGAYRFSIAWPRIQPTGAGAANPAGLDFYDRLVDALLARGIDPVATLFHWDLPQALQDAGGWASRDTAMRFGEYAEVVGERLGDRVKLWVTLNEPFIHFALGHQQGIHAPGLRLPIGELLPIVHHQLLAHGLAVANLRRVSTSPITLANNYTPVWPASDSADDAVAAQVYDMVHNRLFSDPILLGAYPPGYEMLSGVDVDATILEGDLQVISAPIDALGVNYYNPTRVAAPGADSAEPFTIVPVEGYPTTAFGWPVVPDGLRDLLVQLKERYGDRPIWITENGCSHPDVPNDRFRIEYLDGHLRAVRAAIDAGVDVRGYCTWSLMDNFEWAEGYSQRFGLVHVDFATQKRTPRDSFHWYRALCTAAAPRPDLQGGPTG